jgi:hypothetical protein
MMRIHYSTSVGSNSSHLTDLDPFDQFGDPTDGDLSDSVFAPDDRTAGGAAVTTPHATAAAPPTVYATATLTQVLYQIILHRPRLQQLPSAIEKYTEYRCINLAGLLEKTGH